MDRKKELLEAKVALENALEDIEHALSSMNSAKNWGLFDIIGGGAISSLVKRSKIKESNNAMKDVEKSLRNVQKELSDLDMTVVSEATDSLSVNMLDIVFDNTLVDIFIQSDINKSKKQIQTLKSELEMVLNKINEEIALA